MSETLEMAEAVETEETQEPHGEADSTDWKAESRKWEKLAKQNKEAASELEALKAERMSESEKLQARAEKAEAELSRIAAENEKVKAAQEKSKATEVPLDLLMFCNADDMDAFIQAYKAHEQTRSAAPKRQASRIVRDANAPVSNRDTFAEMMENVF